ncbi:hypothetical protein GW17_00015117 [Ensete ventricosum]|nr:hypothetical protein GW17_00015117 [Ensete ventricosum]
MFELVLAYEILCPCSVIKQVPLGNFELDWLLYTADVFFSRALRDKQQVGLFTSHKCVLWISDDGIPDLGGIYEGDTCFADEVRTSGTLKIILLY